MILEIKQSVGGAYARKKSYEYEGKQYEADLKDGDIIKILSSGETVTGEFGEQVVFKIKTRNGDKNFSMNQTSINNLVSVFGKDTTSFVGQDVKVWILKMMVSGKLQNVAYLSGINSTMDEDGLFTNSAVAPVKENNGEASKEELDASNSVNVDGKLVAVTTDIPF